MGKLIVISAPSGAGKTSIVHHLLKDIPEISFSVSASSRKRRKNEVHAKDYYFLGIEGFHQKIKEDAFLEWEQVYENQYYGTLKSEIERIWSYGKTVIFDIDVVGGLNIKKKFPETSISIFIKPPNLSELKNRLINRKPDSALSIESRLSKSESELAFSDKYDFVVINDDLQDAIEETKKIIHQFITS